MREKLQFMPLFSHLRQFAIGLGQQLKNYHIWLEGLFLHPIICSYPEQIFLLSNFQGIVQGAITPVCGQAQT